MKKSTDFYEKITQWATNKGFMNIKANVEGFETPSTFSKNDGAEIVIPDITAVNSGTKYYFEIAIKPSERTLTRKLISKWRLLSFLAKKRGGQLYLIAPRGNKSFTQEVINEYDIEAKFMSLPSLR